MDADEKPIRTRHATVADPTPEYIRDESARIRAEWTEEERAKRYCRRDAPQWTVPEVTVYHGGIIGADFC